MFCDDPKRYPQNLHTQKLYIFLKTLKGIEIQNFEHQNGASPRMNENIIVPPPPSTLSSQIETGAGGVQTQITEKNSDKGVFVGFFYNYIFYGSKGSKHLSGGGGGVQLFIIISFFFFLGGGGGWGVQILISIETYITCDFSGGGGGSGPPIPLWIRAWVRNK